MFPQNVTSMTVKIWGAGGEGVGQCNSGDFSGGGGGFSTGDLTVTPGGTVYVGGTGGSSTTFGDVYGAGKGGGLSAIKYGTTIMMAGGGGGAGQNGNGGGGGALSTAGRDGTGPNSGEKGGAELGSTWGPLVEMPLVD